MFFRLEKCNFVCSYHIYNMLKRRIEKKLQEWKDSHGLLPKINKSEPAMKKVLAFLLLLFPLQFAIAQKLPHLEPVTITEMVPVEMESQQSDGFFHADTNCRFIECRNSEMTVGYLIEPKVDWWWCLGMKGDICYNVGLRDVQRAETVFANTMDRRADSAQQIQRAFTAPYFYQYIRQYVFYLNSEGDTCVHINCIHISEVMPEERFFPYRLRPDLDYIDVFDGDDDFWKADLNLTQGKLLSYDVNGPMIHIVEGRNDEPRGLYDKTLFQYPWPIQEPYSFEQLPTVVKKAVLSQIDTVGISDYQYFSTKYVWDYMEEKDGNGVSIRKRYKKGDYYKIYSDTICRGLDAKGRIVYVGNEEYLGRLDQKYLSNFAGIGTVLAAIEHDMSARGRNYEKYGYIQWVEQVGDDYVVAAIYNPPVPADFLRAYYTIDRKGNIKGVTINQR